MLKRPRGLCFHSCKGGVQRGRWGKDSSGELEQGKGIGFWLGGRSDLILQLTRGGPRPDGLGAPWREMKWPGWRGRDVYLGPGVHSGGGGPWLQIGKSWEVGASGPTTLLR